MLKFIKPALRLISTLVLAGITSGTLFAQTPTACPGFKTWTQGGYGASSNGQPVRYLNANFSSAFPSGLEIGCTNKIRLTSATAVRNFLPQGTAPSYLNAGVVVNPTKLNFNSVLAGQLVTLTLNVKFDQTFPTFAPSSGNLKDLYITSGTFVGMTVQEFLDDANRKIGGCTPVKNASYSEYNNAADRINRAYDNGVSSDNYLACAIELSCEQTPALCFGGNTGSMRVNISGGVPPYSIVSWSGGAIGAINGNVATANNLSAGSYTAVIKDMSGLQKSTTCVVGQPTQLTASSSAGIITCYGGNTTVTVTASGGTAPYTGTGIFTVGAGSYSYTVTDANGCSSVTSVNVTQPDLLVASSSSGQIACYGGTTEVVVTAVGGTAPYSGVGTYTVGAGHYCYTVTDANGCTSETCIDVTQPDLLVASSSSGQIACYGGTTEVVVTAVGGTAPYSGVGTYTVGAGTHCYIVTDANGCTSETCIIVTQPDLLVASSSSGQIACYGGTTEVVVTAVGGTAPYSGVGTYTVGAGTHCYIVTDANGCTSETCIIVTQPDLLVASSSSGQIACYGGTTEVVVTAVGGTAPYSGVGTYTVGAGTHCYIVTDANGCTSETCIIVTQPDLLVASSSSGQIACYGGTTEVVVTAVGGTAPYSGVGTYIVGAGTHCYTVTDANGCTSETCIDVIQPDLLVASSSSGQIACYGGTTEVVVTAVGGTAPYSGVGTYTVGAGTHCYIVTDANGCTSETCIIVTQPDLLVASSSSGQIACYGGTTEVVVTAVGGTAPYSGVGTYTVGAGTHCYIVTDANGCTSETCIIVTQPDLLVASSSSGQIACYGGTTEVVVTAVGGTAPYSGVGTYIVGAGTHCYTVTDANGCTSETCIDVIQPDLLVASSSSGQIACYGGTTEVVVTAVGGTAPYSGVGTYTVGAGTHCYIVTDANGCTSETCIIVTQPDLLVASSSSGQIACYGGTTEVVVTAVGGTAPYSGVGTYTVGAGHYCYTVTDANGCTSETCIDVTQPEPLSCSVSYVRTGANTWDITVSAIGGTSSYDGVGTFAVVSSGEYCYTVTDANGCTSNCCVIIPACDPLRTYTQGGWGAEPNGNNPGTYLHANFASAFPAGLTIGCGSNTRTFSSAQAITNFLPAGGTSSTLPSVSVLAGQLVAATLSAGFDAYDANFAPAAETLGSRVIQSGPFAGMTVGQLLAAANNAIGGCGSNYTLVQFNAALTAINENYDNGNTDNGYLGCSAPASSSRMVKEFSGELYPNPATEASTVKLEASEGEEVTIIVSDFTGRVLFESHSTTTKGINEIRIPVNGIPAAQCMVRVVKGSEYFTKILKVGK